METVVNSVEIENSKRFTLSPLFTKNSIKKEGSSFGKKEGSENHSPITGMGKKKSLIPSVVSSVLSVGERFYWRNGS